MERSAGMNSAAAADSAGSPRKARKAGSVSLGTLLIRYGLLSILFPVMIHGMIKDGVTQWVPTYLSEQFALSASASAVITMVLPLLNLTGAYLARFAGRNHPDEEIRTSIVFFAAALVSILGMLFFGKYSVVLTVIFFGAATSSMMAADTLFINMIPLHFGPIGCVSTVSGFLNSMAYLGSAFSVFGIGVMVKKAGWPATISMWALLTAAALCVCVVCRKQKFSAIAPEKSV
jgi:OPA family glycerol-3-phosphate transporter-like MFS transporter